MPDVPGVHAVAGAATEIDRAAELEAKRDPSAALRARTALVALGIVAAFVWAAFFAPWAKLKQPLTDDQFRDGLTTYRKEVDPAKDGSLTAIKEAIEQGQRASEALISAQSVKIDAVSAGVVDLKANQTRLWETIGKQRDAFDAGIRSVTERIDRIRDGK